MSRLSADEKTAQRRKYTRDNRELWKQLGIRMCSAPVHDDDRAEVLAELEVLRCKRMLKAAKEKSTPIGVIVQLGRRNLTPPADTRILKLFAKQSENHENWPEIEMCIDAAKEAYVKFREMSVAVRNTEDDIGKQRLYAKEVAYGNLSAAWYKLAKARYAGGKSATVFNMQGQFNVEAEDDV
jgi:hypothetical protein